MHHHISTQSASDVEPITIDGSVWLTIATGMCTCVYQSQCNTHLHCIYHSQALWEFPYSSGLQTWSYLSSIQISVLLMLFELKVFPEQVI